MQNEYKIVHQLICSKCRSRDFESTYGSDMELNRIAIVCNRCGAYTEVGQVPIEKDKHYNLVDTPTLVKSELQLGLNESHTKRLFELIAKDNTSSTDRERLAMFFIISGDYELYKKADSFYDFKKHLIKDDWAKNVYLSSSTKKLVQLAFNLYNNSSALAPLELFSGLDNVNYLLAMKAINIRFNQI